MIEISTKSGVNLRTCILIKMEIIRLQLFFSPHTIMNTSAAIWYDLTFTRFAVAKLLTVFFIDGNLA